MPTAHGVAYWKPTCKPPESDNTMVISTKTSFETGASLLSNMRECIVSKIKIIRNSRAVYIENISLY